MCASDMLDMSDAASAFVNRAKAMVRSTTSEVHD